MYMTAIYRKAIELCPAMLREGTVRLAGTDSLPGGRTGIASVRSRVMALTQAYCGRVDCLWLQKETGHQSHVGCRGGVDLHEIESSNYGVSAVPDAWSSSVSNETKQSCLLSLTDLCTLGRKDD